MKKKKVVFFYISLVLVLSFLLLGVCEVFARYMVYRKGIYLKQIDPDYYHLLKEKDPASRFEQIPYVFDKTYGWRLTPNNFGIYRGGKYPKAEFRNEININSWGYRSSKNYDIKSGQKRIAIMGDSFVEAFQVSESNSFPKIIEKILNDKAHDVSVYNFGISATGTIHQYVILQKDIIKIDPDIVILSFFLNDLINNSPYYYTRDYTLKFLVPDYDMTDGEIQIRDFGNMSLIRNYDIIARNYNFKITRGTLDILNILRFLSEKFKSSIFIKYLQHFVDKRFIPQDDYDHAYDVYRKRYPKALEESLDATIQLIEAMNDYCRKHNIYFFVVFLPAREQVNTDLWTEYIKKREHFLNLNDFDLNRPNNILVEELKERGVPYIDLMPYFMNLENKNRLYYEHDGHPNNLGHRKIAGVISRFLVDNIFEKTK